MIVIMAMDKASVRHTDLDGRLHVAESNISKANVCPYLGEEIPDGVEGLGLDAKKVYRLFRPPAELAKAIASFNNLPILKKHVPVTSDKHPHDLVVGTTGTDARFVPPYLKNSLSVWTDEAIAGIESDQQRELSAAYRYEAVMEPGEYQGLPYDGYMRNIVGNHVALVPEGRAGSDVIVGDSKLERPTMAKALTSRKALMLAGALGAHLAPKLAADAKIDLRPTLRSITAKNLKSKRGAVAASVIKLTTGKLAQDAEVSTEEILELVDALSDVTDGEIDDDSIAEAVSGGGDPDDGIMDPPLELDPDDDDDTVAVDADGDTVAQIMAFLEGKLSDEDMQSLQALVEGDTPEVDDPPAQDNGGKPMKAGMDQVIKIAVAQERARNLAAARAREEVFPLVGKVDIAMDHAPAIYKVALDAHGIDTKGIHPSAYPAMVKMIPRETVSRAPTKIAADAAAAAATGFAARFPGARAPKRA